MVKPVTWSQYQETIGDRSGLFAAVVDGWPLEHALYPGSYVDLSPSTAIPSVTYVDTDARAARFFADPGLVAGELAGVARPGAGVNVRFLAADYREPLDVPDHSIDLLISLYAGPTWDSCRRYVRPDGWFLANASHGDASLAALDPGARLAAVVQQRHGDYDVTTDRLDEFLIPKRPDAAEADRIRRAGRGIAYTRPAFAYLFQVS